MPHPSSPVAYDDSTSVPHPETLATARLAEDLVWPGLTTVQAVRTHELFGPNDLPDRERTSWLGVLVAQLIHPLALLLWAAALLALLTDELTLTVAIIVVLAINAAFAFVQERQAEHAVEAIKDALPCVGTAGSSALRQLSSFRVMWSWWARGIRRRLMRGLSLVARAWMLQCSPASQQLWSEFRWLSLARNRLCTPTNCC